jgi:hypothetical protein
MDHPAALHRIKVGVPATVEHSSEAGPETGKWIAETTQVCLSPSNQRNAFISRPVELYYLHGWPEATHEGKGSIAPHASGTCHGLCKI